MLLSGTFAGYQMPFCLLMSGHIIPQESTAPKSVDRFTRCGQIDQGTAIAAGAGKLEYMADAFQSEAVAMLYAINIASQMGCDRVMFETDSTQLKRAVSTEEYDLSALGAIFREIKFQLHVGFSDVCVVNCSRTCNQVAYRLAAFGAKLNSGACVTWLGQFPEQRNVRGMQSVFRFKKKKKHPTVLGFAST